MNYITMTPSWIGVGLGVPTQNKQRYPESNSKFTLENGWDWTMIRLKPGLSGAEQSPPGVQHFLLGGPSLNLHFPRLLNQRFSGSKNGGILNRVMN